SISVEYRVKVDRAYSDRVGPTVYTYIQHATSGFVQKDSFAPSDNVWTTRTITLDPNYCIQVGNSYYMNFYFNIITGLNDFTCNYFFHIDYIKTKFVENQWDGDAYFYKRYGGNINTWENERILYLTNCNDFKRDYGTFTADVDFYLSQSKSYYVQFFNYIAREWQTFQSGTTSGTVHCHAALSRDYVKDNVAFTVKRKRIGSTSDRPVIGSKGLVILYIPIIQPIPYGFTTSCTYIFEVQSAPLRCGIKCIIPKFVHV
ncbi:unnamed protein product, partial [marine sediment metagenome]